MRDTQEEIKRYDAFMREVVHLVVHKYDGALKGEHGTGRNMAPFVETEWGPEAYRIMRAIKEAADPSGLLNPGVIINSSARAHIEDLKDLPQVEEEVDKCIECGFCEISCPSRDLTMTPRRRIVARRALQRLKKEGQTATYRQLLQEYQYHGLDTCATDGLCATDCPVSINTGELVKRLRHENHSATANGIAAWLGRHYAGVEKLARMAIGTISFVDRLGGLKLVTRITNTLHRWWPVMPVWMPELKGARKLPKAAAQLPDVVYFTSCINRVMEGNPAQKLSLPETFLSLCHKAGLQVLIPQDIAGHCCGQPFSSKGFFEAGHTLLMKTIDRMLTWTANGEVPVVCDFSSCTYTFLQNARHLTPAYREKFARLRIIDSVQYLQQDILPRLELHQGDQPVVLHPTCAVTKLQLRQPLIDIARACSSEVVVPAYAGCCGMAGDRGFLVPELTASAAHLEVAEVKEKSQVACYSSATTCEMSLSRQAGKPYRHIAYLLDSCSSARTAK